MQGLLVKRVRVNLMTLLARAVAFGRITVFIEFIAGPKKSASEVTNIGLALHCLIVVTNGSAKHTGFSILVGPDTGMVFLCAVSYTHLTLPTKA